MHIEQVTCSSRPAILDLSNVTSFTATCFSGCKYRYHRDFVTYTNTCFSGHTHQFWKIKHVNNNELNKHVTYCILTLVPHTVLFKLIINTISLGYVVSLLNQSGDVLAMLTGYPFNQSMISPDLTWTIPLSNTNVTWCYWRVNTTFIQHKIQYNVICFTA